MHAARLALLEGALCALLRAAAENFEELNDYPDGISVASAFSTTCQIFANGSIYYIRFRMDADGLDIEYTRGGMPVGGEGV